jgi:hypothetical protein
MAVAVIPSHQFKERMEKALVEMEEAPENEEEERRESKVKGPSRRLSKREKRKLQALKKL